MISACSRSPFPSSASSTRCNRAISSLDRKRVILGRQFRSTPRVGLASMQPLATAKLINLTQDVEGPVVVAGRGAAEVIEPAPDLGKGNAVERLLSEGGQELGFEKPGRGFPRRRLVTGEMRLPPLALDELRNVGTGHAGAAGSGAGPVRLTRHSRRTSSTLLTETGPSETRPERPSASSRAMLAWECRKSWSRTSSRPASARMRQQESSSQSVQRGCAARRDGKSHAPVCSIWSRMAGAGRDSQTVRGPDLLSRRNRCPSR